MILIFCFSIFSTGQVFSQENDTRKKTDVTANKDKPVAPVPDLFTLRISPQGVPLDFLGEIILTHFEPPNIWFGQDIAGTNDQAGIKIVDGGGLMPPGLYNIGDIVGTMQGVLDQPLVTMEWNPLNPPPVLNQGVLAQPRLLTASEFIGDCLMNNLYESELVSVTEPLNIIDPTGPPEWRYDPIEGFPYFALPFDFQMILTNFPTADYIGLPRPPLAIYTGIRTNYSGVGGLFTPRSLADIEVITGELTILPNPLDFDDVAVGSCPVDIIDMNNTGSIPIEIVSMSLQGSDPGFDLPQPITGLLSPQDPAFQIQIEFCPPQAGPFAIDLVIETDILGQIIVPIMGNGLISDDAQNVRQLRDFGPGPDPRLIAGSLIITHFEPGIPGETPNVYFGQDETAGIKIVDNQGVWPPKFVNVGDEIGNFSGVLQLPDCMLEFVPSGYPDVLSYNNVVIPRDLIIPEFSKDCFIGLAYESELVRLVEPILVIGPEPWQYAPPEGILYVGDILQHPTILTNFPSADYIGQPLPMDHSVYTGIRTNTLIDGCNGLITPRSLRDIELPPPPDDNTDISCFEFGLQGCCPGIGTHIDIILGRILVILPHGPDLSNLAPVDICIPPGASIVPDVGVPQDWTQGSIPYTITASDGQTQKTYDVLVEAPPCPEAEIHFWDFPKATAFPPYIDYGQRSVECVILPGLDPSQLPPPIFDLSCEATLCFDFPNDCQTPITDYSNPVDVTVIAQDQSIMEVWTIHVKVADDTPPIVTNAPQQLTNLGDEAIAQSNEPGTIFILHTDFIVPDMDRGYFEDRRNEDLARNTDHDMPGADIFIPTDGLAPGVYFAFANDHAGNVSEQGVNPITIYPGVAQFGNLCDTRNANHNWNILMEGGIIITHVEPGSPNIYFGEDACAGIKIVDESATMPPSVAVGDEITDLFGSLRHNLSMLEFVTLPDPQGTASVQLDAPQVISTGNVVQPIALSWDEFRNRCYSGRDFESQLLTITDPFIVGDDYDGFPDWTYSLDYNPEGKDFFSDNVYGERTWFILGNFPTADYIGTPFLTDPAYYTGIRTNTSWGGLLTPRSGQDIAMAMDPVLYLDPVGFFDVFVGDCDHRDPLMYNFGAQPLNITGVAMNPGGDPSFTVTPISGPIPLIMGQPIPIGIDYCPTTPGPHESDILIETVDLGIIRIIPFHIRGETAVILDMDHCEDFNNSGTGELVPHGWTGSIPANKSLGVFRAIWFPLVDGSNMMYMRNRLVDQGVRVPIELVSPGIVVTGNDPVVSWTEIAYSGFNNAGTNSSPRNLYISTDRVNYTLVDSYLTSDMPDANNGDNYRRQEYSLAQYVGQTVWWKFELISNNNEYIYWTIDNVCFHERISGPVFSIHPNPAEFGDVWFGDTRTIHFEVRNIGLSIMLVHQPIRNGNGDYTIEDHNSYPIEVMGHGSAWGDTHVLEFDVHLTASGPGPINGTLEVPWGVDPNIIVEAIPLNGHGFDCSQANPAQIGENPFFQGEIFTYTPQQDVLLTITSCHPNQQQVDNEYSWDTKLYVYDGCPGQLIAVHDDMNDGCQFNRTQSIVSIPAFGGHTYYIYWPWEFQSLYDDQQMIFTITESALSMTTFNVDMNCAINDQIFDPNQDFVDVPGTFNGWQGSPQMTDYDQDGIYTHEIAGLPVGEFVEYKYRINGDWNTAEFPGGHNRIQEIFMQNEFNDVYDNCGQGPGPDWHVNPSQFEFDGEIIAEVFLDGNPVQLGGILGAFVNGECRGVEHSIDGPPGSGVVLFIIRCYSNDMDGEMLDFKYWHPDGLKSGPGGNIYDIVQHVPFVFNMIVGLATDPFRMDAFSTVPISIPLNQGWTWFSINVENPDMSVANVLGSLTPLVGDHIKDQENSSTYLGTGTGWFGNLFDIDVKKTYKIRLADGGVLDFNGFPVDPANTPIDFTIPGWHWIGYIPQYPLPVPDAFSSLQLSHLDHIKTKAVSSTFYNDQSFTGWFGTMNDMHPLEGYMLRITGTGLLVYPPPVDPVPVRVGDEITQSNITENKLSLNVHNFEFNGSVTAEVFIDGNNAGAPGNTLYAFVENQCRGISDAILFPASGKYVYNMMIHSNAETSEDISFKFYNSQENLWYEFEEILPFNSDMVEADVFDPFELKKGSILDINWMNNDEFNLEISPNPFSYLLNINFTTTTNENVQIAIYDSYGRKVRMLENKKYQPGTYNMKWDGHELPNGIYFIRLETERFVSNKKVVKMN